MLIVGLLIAAVAVAWRAYDDYRDRVKERRRLFVLAEMERVCREQKEKQWASRRAAPINSDTQKRAA